MFQNKWFINFNLKKKQLFPNKVNREFVFSLSSISPSLINSMLHLVSTTNQHKGQGAGSKCQLCHMIISELLPMDSQLDALHFNFSNEETNVKLGSLSLLQVSLFLLS